MLMAKGIVHHLMRYHSAFLHVAKPFPNRSSNTCESISGFLTGIVFAKPKPARRKCENPGRVTNSASAPLRSKVLQRRTNRLSEDRYLPEKQHSQFDCLLPAHDGQKLSKASMERIPRVTRKTGGEEASEPRGENAITRKVR